MVHKGIVKLMILENLKQYVFLVMKLEIVSLTSIWQMMNRTICQSMLENLKVRKDRKILT